MQEKTKNFKPNYFNICTRFPHLISVLIVCCLFVSCSKNDAKQVFAQKTPQTVSETAININTATAETLEKLPNIGAKKAEEIIKHREKYGAFRKLEHLMLVRGISDRRFREIKNLIKL